MKMIQKRPDATYIVVNMETLEHTCPLSWEEAVQMLTVYATAKMEDMRRINRARGKITAAIYNGWGNRISHDDEVISNHGGFAVVSPAWLDREREVRSLKAAVASLEEA